MAEAQNRPSKRPRSSSFPPLGEDASTWLAEHNLVLRYGTSLRLMAQCSSFLNSSGEFNGVDPQGDWEKWTTRLPDTFTLFYAAIVDPLMPEGSGESVHCCLRAVLDGWPTPKEPHNSRLVIDYVACRKESQRRGFASQLVAHVRQAAADKRANLYVLAIEESCVWWMEKGFVLEQNANLNARLNIFPDVHLLRNAEDPHDEGSPEDLVLATEDEEGEGEEDENGDDNEAGSVGVAAGGNLGAAALQMLGADGSDSAHAVVLDDEDAGAEDEDSDLQAALAMSMAQSAAPAASTAAEHAAEAEGGEVDEAAELAAAIAMSMDGQPPMPPPPLPPPS